MNEQQNTPTGNTPAVAPQDVTPGFGSLQSFEMSLKAANLLSKSTLVPKEYQGNLPNCVIALNMAGRMNADPLMVMQNLYIVHGRPGFSSQFLISTINSSGRFSALRYEWIGKQGSNDDEWGCRAWAIEKASGEKLVGATVTIGLAKKEGWYDKSGSKWKTMPEQMLMYRAASWFVRAYAPELAMGMQTADELEDIVDVQYEILSNANKNPVDIITDQPKSETGADPEQPPVSAPEAAASTDGAAPLGPGF